MTRDLVRYPAMWVLVAICLWLNSGCGVYRSYSEDRFWKSIQHQIDTSGLLSNGFTGLVVYDADTGKEIYNTQGNKNFTPASNVKLLTLYSCMNTLGDSIPAFRYEVSDSFLYVWPMADPTLMHPYFQRSNVLNKIKELAGDRSIRLSLGHASQPHYGKGWMWDDYLDDYQAEITALPMYGNVVQIQYIDSNWSAVPVQALDSQRLSEGHTDVWRPWHNNEFYLPAKVESDKTYFREIPVSQAHQKNVILFKDLLGRDVDPVSVPVSEGASILYSIPVDTVYRRMMQQSDNMLAEHLLLTCGMVMGDSLSTSYTIDTITKKFLLGMPTGLKWVDGSGLSRYNQASPAQMAWILGRLWQSVSQERLFSYMDSGKRRGGTLGNMFSSDDAPDVYAKTGSMQGVYALSGYLKTKNLKVLIFSIMHNHFQGPVSGARKATRDLIARIGNHY